MGLKSWPCPNTHRRPDTLYCWPARLVWGRQTNPTFTTTRPDQAHRTQHITSHPLLLSSSSLLQRCNTVVGYITSPDKRNEWRRSVGKHRNGVTFRYCIVPHQFLTVYRIIVFILCPPSSVIPGSDLLPSIKIKC